MAHDVIRLDDLYRMTARIYREQNAGRSVESTFLHLAEVCGMLSGLDRQKPRGELDFVDALCKSLGWFFPLMAQLGVASVERMIFRKYPNVCPYCRTRPHVDIECKAVRGLAPGVLQHQELRVLYMESLGQRPVGLDDWQQMFQQIYPRTSEDRQGRSTLGLLEELGELAEAIRVFDRHKKYLLGEAADVFSYLMGIANEYGLRHAMNDGATFSFETEYLVRYPGLCVDCGNAICACPHVPNATVGRMAKELDIGDDEQIFGFAETGDVAEVIVPRVVARVSGYPSLLRRFPMDRGDANHALVKESNAIATAVEEADPEVAKRLRSAAEDLAEAESAAGDRRHSEAAGEAVRTLQAVFREPIVAEEIAHREIDLLARPALPNTMGVLVIGASPDDEQPLRPDREMRVIEDSISRAKLRERFQVTALKATTIDDLRRAMLEGKYSIVHFAGHGDSEGFVLEDDRGESFLWSYDDMATYMERFAELECVILNACFSAKGSMRASRFYVVSMETSIGDRAAIEFARGFYDALGAGRDYDFAVSEGKVTAESKVPGSKVNVIAGVTPGGGGAK